MSKISYVYILSYSVSRYPPVEYFADNLVSPCLWVGTALGNVFVVVLNLPVREERDSQPVLSITTGT